MAAEHEPVPPRRHRPRSATVFIAAFVAGAAAAVGINRALDVHLAQAKPQVECEPIFVALRSLPQGVPVTVWDVALRDWPKAMMPSAAVRVNDPFEGCLLKHPLREGQPLLTVQLLKPQAPVEAPTMDEAHPELEEEVFVAPVPATAAAPAEADHSSAAVAAEASEVSVPVITATVAQPQEFLATVQPQPPVQPQPAVESPIAADAGIPAETTIASESWANSELVEQPTAGAGIETVADTPAVANAPVDPPQMEDFPVDRMTAGAAPEPAAEAVLPLPEPPPQSLTLAAIRREPTPVATAPATQPVAPVAPITIGPQLLGQSADAPFPMDLPSRPVADIASLPSVMARDSESSRVDASESTDSSVRYLVVPERIAQQADTSFTIPAAPGVGDVVSEQHSAANRKQASSQQQASKKSTSPRQNGTGQNPPRDSNRTPAGSRSQATGSTVTAKQPPQNQQPRSADRAATESRTWGGMFPNVSAGLDAINSWRSRGREAVADESPAAAPRR
jgi:hypothetical protein